MLGRLRQESLYPSPTEPCFATFLPIEQYNQSVPLRLLMGTHAARSESAMSVPSLAFQRRSWASAGTLQLLLRDRHCSTSAGSGSSLFICWCNCSITFQLCTRKSQQLSLITSGWNHDADGMLSRQSGTTISDKAESTPTFGSVFARLVLKRHLPEAPSRRRAQRKTAVLKAAGFASIHPGQKRSITMKTIKSETYCAEMLRCVAWNNTKSKTMGTDSKIVPIMNTLVFTQYYPGIENAQPYHRIRCETHRYEPGKESIVR